jgi:hypothetical protein
MPHAWSDPSGPGLPKAWPTVSGPASASVSVPVSVTHTYTALRHSEGERRYCDQVPAPTSIFHVARYLGSSIFVLAPKTMG